jgi:pentapeptide MXKDX repeat protein
MRAQPHPAQKLNRRAWIARQPARRKKHPAPLFETAFHSSRTIAVLPGPQHPGSGERKPVRLALFRAGMEPFNKYGVAGVSFHNLENNQMRKVLLAAVCVAFVGGISAASAQTTGPAAQDTMKTNSPMDSQAKMMKKKKMKKGMMEKDGMMKNDMMKKDDMKK